MRPNPLNDTGYTAWVITFAQNVVRTESIDRVKITEISATAHIIEIALRNGEILTSDQMSFNRAHEHQQYIIKAMQGFHPDLDDPTQYT